MATVDILYMSIQAIHDQPGKSFEEVRMEDYLIAYRTTGRPPVPVPQEPTSDQQRTLLNLPPLFKPYSARDTGPASLGPTPLFSFSNSPASGISTPSVPLAITRPEDLPDGQDFRTTTSDGEVFQTISVMPTFRAFSAEELRYYAYLKGHKLPPSSVQMVSFAHAPLNSNTLPPEMTLNRSTLNPLTSSTSDTLLSISAQPGFGDHSFEELRVAYLQAGRELTSQEIFSASATPVAAQLPRPLLFMGNGVGGAGGTFARAPPVRPF